MLPLLYCCCPHLFSICLEIESEGVSRPTVQKSLPACPVHPVASPSSFLRVSLVWGLGGGTLSNGSCSVLSRVFMCLCYWQVEKGSVSLSLALTGERKMWSSDWAERNLQLITAVTLDFVALLWRLPLTVCLVFWLEWKILGNWGPRLSSPSWPCLRH